MSCSRRPQLARRRPWGSELHNPRGGNILLKAALGAKELRLCTFSERSTFVATIPVLFSWLLHAMVRSLLNFKAYRERPSTPDCSDQKAKRGSAVLPDRGGAAPPMRRLEVPSDRYHPLLNETVPGAHFIRPKQNGVISTKRRI